MTTDGDFEIFLSATPGFEPALGKEAEAAGFKEPKITTGGVTIKGGWPEVWRANLELRGAGRVLARIDEFRAMHLAQLDKRARRIVWGEVLRPDVPFRVQASCSKSSRIYHSGAAAQRIEKAIREELGAKHSPTPKSSSRSASMTIFAPSLSTLRASRCTSAATRKPSPRRRCARRWHPLPETMRIRRDRARVGSDVRFGNIYHRGGRNRSWL